MKLADLRIERHDSVVCATLRGDVDMSNSLEIREELSQAIPNEALGLVLDLAGVDYLDSAGIHLIHRLSENLRSRGQKLILIIPPDSLINDTLRLAGLDWAQDRAESVEAAREVLQSGRA